MGRVVITTELPTGADEPLRADDHDVVNLAMVPTDPDSRLLERARGADGIVSVLWNRIDRELFDAVGPGLRVVANVAVGYDNVDVDAARAAGVTVCNTPGVLDEATADVAMLLVLAAARRATAAEHDLRAGRWTGWTVTGYVGQDLHDRTLALVGYGRIARAIERRAAGFGMRVVHHTRTDTGRRGWIEDLDEMLAGADVVSLHVPLTPGTRHLIDERRLGLMKPTAVLVNTARGPVVDEAALTEALERGTIFGAGLDVFDGEPQVDPRLLAAPNITLLPHIGSATVQTRSRMAHMACEAVADVLAGRPARHVVF